VETPDSFNVSDSRVPNMSVEMPDMKPGAIPKRPRATAVLKTAPPAWAVNVRD
jgi:hypothetical protein